MEVGREWNSVRETDQVIAVQRKNDGILEESDHLMFTDRNGKEQRDSSDIYELKWTGLGDWLNVGEQIKGVKDEFLIWDIGNGVGGDAIYWDLKQQQHKEMCKLEGL